MLSHTKLVQSNWVGVNRFIVASLKETEIIY